MKLTSLAEFDDLMAAAALGEAPLPLPVEHIAKAYAHFGGVYPRQVILRMLANTEVLSNLTHDFDHLTCTNEHLTALRQRIEKALPKTLPPLSAIEKTEQTEKLLARYFENPEYVHHALKATTKKDWRHFLVEAPQSEALLTACAALSSEDFFKNNMPLAFMEIEPNVYGKLHAPTHSIGFAVRSKMIDIIQAPRPQPTSYETSSTTTTPHSATTNQSTQKPRKQTWQPTDIPNKPKKDVPDSAFLHKKFSEKPKRKQTMATIDLSNRSETLRK